MPFRRNKRPSTTQRHEQHLVEVVEFQTVLMLNYQARCDCGKYRSRWHVFAGYAERDGLAHIKGKGGNGRIAEGRRQVADRRQ